MKLLDMPSMTLQEIPIVIDEYNPGFIGKLLGIKPVPGYTIYVPGRREYNSVRVELEEGDDPLNLGQTISSIQFSLPNGSIELIGIFVSSVVTDQLGKLLHYVFEYNNMKVENNAVLSV